MPATWPPISSRRGRPIAISAPIGDPRFELPLSGWYWQVGRPGGPPREVRSSKSLFGTNLAALVPPDGAGRTGEIRRGYGPAPDGRLLRIVERDIDLGEDGRYVIRVAGLAEDIDRDVRRFIYALVVYLRAARPRARLHDPCCRSASACSP
jgi:hypothetical protein